MDKPFHTLNAQLAGKWMTIEEAASEIGCSKRTVMRMIADGRLERREKVHLGRVLVSKKSIRDFNSAR